MDSAFENLSQIEGLDLLGNKIQKITTISFGSLTHLERLYLDENQISQVCTLNLDKQRI
jgi:Leucine-rich repeat (LRR) protein